MEQTATATIHTRADSTTALVDEAIRQRLDTCNYAFYFCKVTWQFRRGVLTLRGCVPTYNLQESLQSLLHDVPHVRRVVNKVDVVNANGISSIRPR